MGSASRLALVLGLAVCLPAATADGARRTGESGCLDVVSGEADYVADLDGASGRVRVLAELAADSCRSVDYSLRAYDAGQTYGTVTVRGTGDPLVLLEVVVPVRPAGSLIGIEVTTARKGEVVDVAPDPLPLDATTDQNVDGVQDNAQLLDGAAPETLGSLH